MKLCRSPRQPSSDGYRVPAVALLGAIAIAFYGWLGPSSASQSVPRAHQLVHQHYICMAYSAGRRGGYDSHVQ